MLTATWWFVICALAAATLDLSAKQWIFNAYPGSLPDNASDSARAPRLTPTQEIIPGLLYIHPATNRGGVFGIGQGKTPIFIGLSTLIVGVILWLFWTQARNQRLLAFGLGLVLGGALGNLYDRVIYHCVRDFILIQYRRFEWPAFNPADAFICIGAGIIILASLLQSQPSTKPASAQKADKADRR